MMKTNRPPTFKIVLLCIAMALLQSCYTVRLVSTKGAPEPAQHEDADLDAAGVGDFYKDKTFTVVEKVVPSSIFTENIQLPTARANCASGELFSVEYKNTFGGSLLYLVTFGGKRKVKMTYVCMKEQRQ